MSKKKHPIEKCKPLSISYTQCLKKHRSGYGIYDQVKPEIKNKNNKYLNPIKSYPEYFESKPSIPYDKYKSKISPLITIIDNKLILTSNEKKLLRNILDRQYFRNCITIESGCINHNHILEFISYLCLIDYVKKSYIKYLKTNGYKIKSKTEIQKLIKTMDEKFLPELKIKSTTKQISQAEKLKSKFQKLPTPLSEKLIHLNPKYHRDLDLMKYFIIYTHANLRSK